MDPVSMMAIGSAASSALGGIFGSKSKKRQIDRNIQFQQEQSKVARQELEPWKKAGEVALERISRGMGDGSFSMEDFDFKEDPGYAFRMDEGQKAIERGAAARGYLQGGKGLKDVLRFGQDYGSQEYDKAYNREMGERNQEFQKNLLLSQGGQNAASTGVGVMQNTAGRVGNLMQDRANTSQQMYSDLATSANRGLSNYMLGNMLKPTVSANLANTGAVGGAVGGVGGAGNQGAKNWLLYKNVMGNV